MTDERPPILGQVRLLHPEQFAEPGISETTDYEVWDGTKWRHSSENNSLKIIVSVGQ